MDVPGWSYSVPEQNFVGESPNKRNATILERKKELSSGLPGSSWNRREDWVLPLQRSTNERSTGRTCIVENLQASTEIKRISSQNAPIAEAQTSHPRFVNSDFHNLSTHTSGLLDTKPKSYVPDEPFSSYNFSVKVPLPNRQQGSYDSFTEQRNDHYLSHSGTKDVQATNGLPMLNLRNGDSSGQGDTISSKFSLKESDRIVSPQYFPSMMKPLEKMMWTSKQLSAVTPSPGKELDGENLGNFINVLNPNLPQNIIHLPEKWGSEDLPNLKKKCYFDQHIEGLGANTTNTVSNLGTKFSSSSIFTDGKDIGFCHPGFSETEPSSASMGISFNSNLVDDITETQRVSRLMSRAVSGITSCSTEVLASNNTTHLCGGLNLANLDQQTGLNVSHTENVSHAFPRKLKTETSNTNLRVPEERKAEEGLPHVLSYEEGMHSFHEGKAILATEGTLWDGFLQLNASVNVAAVAYFKSGEQNLKINWPDHIEVKGRVRLEAFEKFIQDLPRSRHRSLMVVSLCGNVRSSEAGLIGMEQVSKSYLEGKKIGFAKLSPGIDLYICPRSEVVITILAKHGFYKGMATVRDKECLLIGCIIWRKRHTTSNAVQKSTEKRKVMSPEKTLDSPSSFQHMESKSHVPCSRLRTHHSGLFSSSSESASAQHMNVPINENIQRPSAAAVAMTFPHTMVSEEANISTSNDLPKDSLTLPISLPESSFIPDACQAPGSSLATGLELSYLQSTIKLSVVGENSNSGAVLQKSILETGLGTEPKIFEKQPNEQNLNASDDDDLPEFDFSVTCHPPKCSTYTPRVSHAFDFHHSADVGMKKLGDPALSMMNSNGALNPNESELLRLPKSLSNNIQGGAMLNLMEKSDLEVSCLLPHQGKSPVEQVRGNNSRDASMAKNTLPTSASHLRKLWDDDDDSMPEWSPPYLEQDKPVELPVLPAVRPSLQLLSQPPVGRIHLHISSELSTPPANRPMLPLPLAEAPATSGSPKTFQIPSEYNPLPCSRMNLHGHLLPGMLRKEPIRPNMGGAPRPDGARHINSSEAFRLDFKSKFEVRPDVNRKVWMQ